MAAALIHSDMWTDMAKVTRVLFAIIRTCLTNKDGTRGEFKIIYFIAFVLCRIILFFFHDQVTMTPSRMRLPLLLYLTLMVKALQNIGITFTSLRDVTSQKTCSTTPLWEAQVLRYLSFLHYGTSLTISKILWLQWVTVPSNWLNITQHDTQLLETT